MNGRRTALINETHTSATPTPAAPGSDFTPTRVVIERIVPQVDGGRFPVKCSTGEIVRVEADVFGDGHDRISVALRHRRQNGEWFEVAMRPLVNDRWTGEFEVHGVGWHEFTIIAWVDRFATWRSDLQKRLTAQQNVEVDLAIGSALVDDAARQTDGDVARSLQKYSQTIRSADSAEAVQAGTSESLQALMRSHGPRAFQTEWPTPVRVWVDRVLARCSSWYEIFPRSASPDQSQSGTLRDVEDRLDDIAGMQFDVLYLPPVHPIGRAYRKGRNNSPKAEPGDVGSPWAIGGPEGGHDAINPDLGTMDDFDRLVASAKAKNIELAMDLAFQCSPDHPYVRDHPNWFRHRPDGSIQYAENPPKKYQDIYPFDFECEDWQALWAELLRVVLFWHGHGIRVFRVDNPHTKPFPFWEWLIGEVHQRDPNVLFLAEAFTRPKIMYRLAKLGFSQSYTYFTWRNDPASIEKYYTELTSSPVVDFFRPNSWPNTPDILPEFLQSGSRAAYIVRVVLAGTLTANYGVYGPAFELMESRPVKPGTEEYLDSEKYQTRQWDLDRPDSLSMLLARLNRIRRANPALQQDRTLKFHYSDNPVVVCFSKSHGENTILTVVNTDPYHTQLANLRFDLTALGVTADQPYQVHDLLTDARYRWQGEWGVVKLDPGTQPAHIFAIRRRSRTEADFEYFI